MLMTYPIEIRETSLIGGIIFDWWDYLRALVTTNETHCTICRRTTSSETQEQIVESGGSQTGESGADEGLQERTRAVVRSSRRFRFRPFDFLLTRLSAPGSPRNGI